MNLKITFLGNVKVRIDRKFRRNANTDNVGGINSIDFGEECQIGIQNVPFRRNLPNAVRVNFVAHMEYNKKLKAQ